MSCHQSRTQLRTLVPSDLATSIPSQFAVDDGRNMSRDHEVEAGSRSVPQVGTVHRAVPGHTVNTSVNQGASK